MKHVYVGPAPDIQHHVACEQCGYPPRHGNHLSNGGVFCDNPTGACSCGAWHDQAETDERIRKSGP